MHDIVTWIEAFSTYTRVWVDTCPELAADLLAYQAIIVDANTKYYNDAWLAYDRKFRLALASLPHAYSWGIIDPNLWQSCHTSKGCLPCTLCSMVHPLTPMGCPFRGELPSCPHVGESQSPSTPRFQGKVVCRNYNNGICYSRTCPAHTSASLAVAATHPNSVVKPFPPRQSNPNEIRHIGRVRLHLLSQNSKIQNARYEQSLAA